MSLSTADDVDVTASPPAAAAAITGAATPIYEKLEKFCLVDPTFLDSVLSTVADAVTEKPAAVDDGDGFGKESVKVDLVSDESEEEEESSSGEEETSDSSSSSDDESSIDLGTKDGEGIVEIDDDDDGMVMWEEDDVEVVKGPIKSKHEIEDLPPVPPVEVSLEPHHQTSPVGVISSIMGSRVVVEGSEKHNPLSEGSILWITETRLPLGIVDEIFGPVKNPYYIVRYNSDEEVPAGICMGSAVSFVMEFAKCVLNMQDLYKKGYDASGQNDGESTDEAEFSDDEKEAEHRRSLRQSKRAANNAQDEKQEKPFVKMPNLKCGPTSNTGHHGRASAKDMGNNSFNGPPRDDRRNGNQVPSSHTRTNFRAPPSQECASPQMSTFNGAPLQRCMQPRVPYIGTTDMGQQLSAAPGFHQAQSVGGNPLHLRGTSATSGNAFGSSVPMPAATPQHMQISTCSSDPSQKLLVQQINALMANVAGPQVQMVTQGGYRLNGLPSQLGDVTHHSHHQNQVLNGFPNVATSQQQFVPNIASPANSPWLGGPLHASQSPYGTQSGGMNPVQFTPSGAAAQQFMLGQAQFGCGNAPEQGAWGSGNGHSYVQPQPLMNQGGIHHGHYNQPFHPASVGTPGQLGAGQGGFGFGNAQDLLASGLFNAALMPQPSLSGGGMHQMQFNPSAGPTSYGVPGQLSVSNVPDQGASGSFNAGIFGHAQLDCNNMQNQGASASSNMPIYMQTQPSVNQGGLHPPMQFSPSVGPDGQPPQASDQGEIPARFNPGRNTPQRGGRHRSFGRGGRSQNR